VHLHIAAVRVQSGHAHRTVSSMLPPGEYKLRWSLLCSRAVGQRSFACTQPFDCTFGFCVTAKSLDLNSLWHRCTVYCPHTTRLCTKTKKTQTVLPTTYCMPSSAHSCQLTTQGPVIVAFSKMWLTVLIKNYQLTLSSAYFIHSWHCWQLQSRWVYTADSSLQLETLNFWFSTHYIPGAAK